ncbi:pyridoxamine 5'-phosphate oxidase family protein [Actinomadura violacea]|uniref:Pyridoxamine 5'-phosphate oxidase n=1 Tax=Actinomadura violacea TaxID=2819934 RepID=A0ABS3RQQ8_9ACTN|nr:pyridoxamine 5'-phosphate oxidase family protein [Actinomadura violacea]MBO2459080.1 pyridoxamine 5'-phosphate oxidase [Actinomadura violacea]
MTTSMTKAERETFLADTRIGMLSVPDGRAPLLVPIWYAYEPGGDIRISTPSTSRKLTLIKQAGQAGFAVQQEEMPYKFVSVDGPITGYEPTDPAEYHRWSIRYLGPADGERFFAAIEETLPHWTTISIRPTRWRTFDFSKEFA